MLDSNSLAETLSARFRLALIADVPGVSDGESVRIRAADVPTPNGFAVKVTPGWRSVDAEFVPDRFAGDLVRNMGESDPSARLAFAKIAQSFISAGARVWIRINQTAVADFEGLPPAPWNGFELKVHRMSAAGTENAEALLLEAVHVAAMCLALVLVLLPLEDEDGAASALFESGLPEGARTRVEVNRYERNPVNRAACIASHGAVCCACGFDFGKVYGALGAGYIEVHHVVPVSKMGGRYVVDPARDLIPLCGNCHAMIHRRDPPVSLDELKTLVSRSS